MGAHVQQMVSVWISWVKLLNSTNTSKEMQESQDLL